MTTEKKPVKLTRAQGVFLHDVVSRGDYVCSEEYTPAHKLAQKGLLKLVPENHGRMRCTPTAEGREHDRKAD